MTIPLCDIQGQHSSGHAPTPALGRALAVHIVGVHGVERLAVLEFGSVVSAMEAVTLILTREPSAVELAEAGLGPATGVVRNLSLSPGPFCRIDSHLYEGFEVTSHYDSLLAKVISWGADRSEAICRLDNQLAETSIDGLITTVEFLRQMLCSKNFQKGNYWTTFIEDTQENWLANMAATKDVSKDLAVVASVVAKNHLAKQDTPQKVTLTPWQQSSLSRLERC